MRKIEKFKLNKTHITLIVVASVLILSLLGYIIASAVAKHMESNEPYTPPDTIEGEDTYLGLTVAYPVIKESEILSILVKNSTGIYDLTRWPDENGSFWLGYGTGDEIENMVQYIPPIVSEDSGFDYESLYAIETNDGYGRIYLLTYMCTALGSPYFTERIELPSADTEEGKTERDNMLRDYGLTLSEATTVSFAYATKDSEGEVATEGEHTLVIGDRAISGSGFYYMVDGRNYIYYTHTNYFEYALKGFHTFIKGMLVSEGLDIDGTYGPYLTTSFIEWVREMHNTEGDAVVDGAHIVAKGDVSVPIASGAEYNPESDGYEREYGETLTIDLEELKVRADYDRISDILIGKNVGVYYDDKTGEGEKIVLTLLDALSLTDVGSLDFKSEDSLTYTYTVHAIESILTDSGEIFTEGSEVSPTDRIKVSYSLKVGGVSQNENILHAVLDLSSETLPASAKTALSEAKVGELESDITFDIVYTAKNALNCKEKLIITAITAIYDSEGAIVDKAEDGTYVTLRYYVETDGKRGDSVTETFLVSSDEKLTARRRAIAAAVKGKGVSDNLSVVAYNSVSYYEIFRSFSVYELTSIEYFVTSEEVVSFRFANPSERDPFYGESFFENRTEKNSLYGLNANVCETVVEVLGGIYQNTGSTATGLSGQTVALGLTPENMEKYGLYAYKIYFELPRGIYDTSENNLEEGENPYNDALASFGWYSTLGFTLYISEEDPETGNRYVGSDMYDLIALVDGENLTFLDYDFAEFWARKNLIYTDIANLEDLRVEFDMEDVKGDYAFGVTHKTFYVTDNGLTYEYNEGAAVGDELRVAITQSGDCMETEFSKKIEELGTNSISVTALYHYVMNGGEIMPLIRYDTVGVSHFKNMYEILVTTRYEGILSEEEQAAALEGEPVMRMRIKISSSAFYYNYDFYRISDRKVMVAVSRTDKDGNALSGAKPLSDFYISTLSFKKLVSAYTALLNGEEVDSEMGYGN